jgi:hypothetical protein
MSIGSIGLSRTPTAHTFALCQLVWASCAPKLLSNHTFVDTTPRTWCAAQRKGPFPCRSATDVDCRSRTMNSCHYETALCKEGVARKVQHAAERAHLVLQNTFTTYGKGLERVEVFKYLGRLFAFNDTDSQVVRGKLKKAQGIWARISHTLRAEIASPRVCSVFYKATVLSFLLFGSETWNLSPGSLKVLERFHIRAAWPWHMAGKRLMKLSDGTWTYPNSTDVLKDVGLKTIAHYFAVCWQHIDNYIVNKLISSACVSGERR